MWAIPTRVGERVWIHLRPGLALTDLQDRADLIAVACWADTAIAERAPGFNSAFVRLDIKRRDALTAPASTPLLDLITPGTPPRDRDNLPVPTALDLPDVTATEVTRQASAPRPARTRNPRLPRPRHPPTPTSPTGSSQSLRGLAADGTPSPHPTRSGLGFPSHPRRTLMKGPASASGTVPVGPLLSMYDPIYVGVDEFGGPVYTRLIYRNLLAAGEPGGGKSGLLNIFAAHAALSVKNRNVLFDGKQVELGMWDDLADEFVGPDLDHATHHPAPPAAGDGQPLHLAPRARAPQNRALR